MKNLREILSQEISNVQNSTNVYEEEIKRLMEQVLNGFITINEFNERYQTRYKEFYTISRIETKLNWLFDQDNDISE